MSLAMSIASRGLDNKKIDIETKQLRYVSCYGLETLGPCPYLKKSSSSNHYYCGKCGCGDHAHTWLVKNEGEYSKLDYPALNCPMKMPGFTNYDPGYTPSEIKYRKQHIESIEPEKLKLVQITINSDELKERVLNNVNNVLKNS